jgi:hypothetical protein
MSQVQKEQIRSAYREGIFVRALGRLLDNNPYPPNSEDGLLWEEGWRLIDCRRPSATRFVESSPAKPVLAFTQKSLKNPIPGHDHELKRASNPSFFLLYFAAIGAFGGFLVLMLMDIARLSH